jgi:hypothetical protein
MNIVAGLHDEAVSSGRERRSAVCFLSRGTNVVAGSHDEGVSLGIGKGKHCVLSVSRY